MAYLSELEHRLIRLFVAATQGDWEKLAQLRRAAPAGEPNAAWREAMLQLHLFAGFPRQVEAYEVLAEAGGLGPELPRTPEEDFNQRGRALFERIYGDKTDRVLGRIQELEHDFGDWICAHAYGTVLARPGLEASRRELLAVGALASLGQMRQLASHARGAIRCGATPEEVLEVLDVAAPQILPERLASARQVAKRFAERAARAKKSEA